MTDLPLFDKANAAHWLAQQRYGQSEVHRQAVRAQIEAYLQRGLSMLTWRPDMTLLDVGCGDGILGAYAQAHFQRDLQIIGIDQDAQVIASAQAASQSSASAPRSRFFVADAQTLTGVADGSVDVLTTRSCLAYVDDKSTALQHFERVLKPGGQLLLIEPVFRDEAIAAANLRQWHQAEPDNAELALMHAWKSAQYPDDAQAIQACAITNYGERELFAWVQQAGFESVHLELHLDQTPAVHTDWATFVQVSPHLWAPPLAHIMQTHMTQAQRQDLESMLKPLVESQAFPHVDRMVYIQAVKKME